MTQPAAKKQGPRMFPGPRNERRAGQRRVKMLRPVCDKQKMEALGLPEGDACQDAANMVDRWWESCSHNPYFSLIKRVIRTPVLGEPDENGERLIERYEEKISYQERPNSTQVTLSRRVNWGNGPALWREERGYLLPEERGVAPYCQYRDCWSHDIVVRSKKFGDYCSDWQAREAAVDQLGKVIEARSDLPGAAEKREQQLQEINL